ncbi:MAG: PrsW family intramembrane metalloprotease [Blastocatellia bacterium]|nr:PrsW family intramembrane metalloprotease [Blastocatellia bacterium]
MMIIFLSLLPCVLWLLFFYIQDRHDRAPLSTVAITFLIGIFSAVPASILNSFGLVFLYLIFGEHHITTFLQFFTVVGPVEEAVKMLAVLIFAYRQQVFDEPVDGIVYSAAAAMGFAAIENVLYVSQFSVEVLAVRGPLANAGHALFSAFWGLALSKAKASPNVRGHRTRIIISGLIAAAFVHGLYDYILTVLADMPPIVSIIPILTLMAGMFVYVEYKIASFVKNSHKRKELQTTTPVLKCPRCSKIGYAGDTCRCGQVLPSFDAGEHRYCRRCKTKNPPGSTECTNCQMSLLRLSKNPPASMQPHFVKYTDGQEEVAFVIDKHVISIGKTLDNNFVIEQDGSVSNSHARIYLHQTGVHVIQDLNSINGTFVNGQRVTEGYLQNGYEVRFGQSRFIYRAVHWQGD